MHGAGEEDEICGGSDLGERLSVIGYRLSVIGRYALGSFSAVLRKRPCGRANGYWLSVISYWLLVKGIR